MRNLLIGLLILAAGGYYLSNASGSGSLVRGGLSKPSGNISGYSAAPRGSIGATKGVAGSIVK